MALHYNAATMSDLVRKKTLLLVGDNKTDMRALIKILQNDYTLLKTDNGKDALKLLNIEAGNDISAVILALQMPEMDGYEVITRMRSSRKLQQIPIIVVSGNEDDSDGGELRALALGANDYITKPFRIEIIKRRIANVIYMRETSRFINNVQHDDLTGLYTKEYFCLRVDEVLRSGHDKKYDIICCDIKQFKLVNNLYGFETGNNLLKHVALIFREIIKDKGIYGRVGSDVFAIFTVHKSKYTALFAEITQKLNEFNIKMNIVMRFGIYQVEDDDSLISDMCAKAQLAISAITDTYNSYYKVYDSKLRQQFINEQFITSNMKKALAENQFVVFFQPKYELKNEKVVGAEALVRWNHPVKGMIPPDEFIPIFENNGFITELDIFVWETCCRKIREWIDAGISVTPISVNVSRKDIYNPNIDKILISLMRKYMLSPKYLYLEITESAYTENSEQLIDVVTRLKNLGFLIEMDDFGSGYSSLHMLSELPIDVLKLDIRFLQNHQKKNSRGILSFIVSLAKWMNLLVIAEGAETAEQVALLRSLNCDCVQGYYFSKPISEIAFDKLIKKHKQYIPAPELKTDYNRSEMTTYHPETIIYLGENDDSVNSLRTIFEDKYTVIRCLDYNEFIASSEVTADISAVLVEFNKRKAENELPKLVKHCQSLIIPLISVHSDMSQVSVAVDAGVTDYVVKPFLEGPVKRRIDGLVYHSQMLSLEKNNQLDSAIQRMKTRAEHDSLTGLLNRAEFEIRVRQNIEENKEKSGYFMMIDIDNFKYINDTYGHSVGDNTLKSIGHAIDEYFTDNEIIGRMGGDEFAIFVSGVRRKQIEESADNLCHELNFTVQSLPVYCSIGICAYPDYGKSFQELYENSDIALLHAKRNGKSQYKFYENGMIARTDCSFDNKASNLLDNASDAVFVCDDETNKLIYINDIACNLIGKKKNECIGEKCYELFWERCHNCTRCVSIDKCKDCFYFEDTVLKDGKTRVRIKASVDVWDGRKVKIHYLKIL